VSQLSTPSDLPNLVHDLCLHRYWINPHAKDRGAKRAVVGNSKPSVSRANNLYGLQADLRNRFFTMRALAVIHFFLPHRALAALAAIWERLRGPKAAAEPASICSFLCSSEDSWQISIHSCRRPRLSRNVRVCSFRPCCNPSGWGCSASSRYARLLGQSASYQPRVHTNHQVITRLSKRWEQRRR